MTPVKNKTKEQDNKFDAKQITAIKKNCLSRSV